MTLTQGIDIAIVILLLTVLTAVFSLLLKVRSLIVSFELTLARLQSEMTRLVAEANELVDGAGVDVSKFENLLDAANSVTSSMGSASRLAYTAVASPVVKAKALRAGLVRLALIFRSDPTRPRSGR